MPRAESPEQMEVAIRYAAHDDGTRYEDYATEFIVLFKDQFGTTCISGQHYGDLALLLHPNVNITGMDE